MCGRGRDKVGGVFEGSDGGQCRHVRGGLRASPEHRDTQERFRESGQHGCDGDGGCAQCGQRGPVERCAQGERVAVEEQVGGLDARQPAGGVVRRHGGDLDACRGSGFGGHDQELARGQGSRDACWVGGRVESAAKGVSDRLYGGRRPEGGDGMGVEESHRNTIPPV